MTTENHQQAGNERLLYRFIYDDYPDTRDAPKYVVESGTTASLRRRGQRESKERSGRTTVEVIGRAYFAKRKSFDLAVYDMDYFVSEVSEHALRVDWEDEFLSPR